MLPNVASAPSIEVFKILLVHNISLLRGICFCISVFMCSCIWHKFHRKKSSYRDAHVTFTAEWRGVQTNQIRVAPAIYVHVIMVTTPIMIGWHSAIPRKTE